MNSFLAAGGDNFTHVPRGTGQGRHGPDRPRRDGRLLRGPRHGRPQPAGARDPGGSVPATTRSAASRSRPRGSRSRRDAGRDVSFSSSEAIEADVLGRLRRSATGCARRRGPEAARSSTTSSSTARSTGSPLARPRSSSVVGLSTRHEVGRPPSSAALLARVRRQPVRPGGRPASSRSRDPRARRRAQRPAERPRRRRHRRRPGARLRRDGCCSTRATAPAASGRASLVGTGFRGQVVLPGDLNGDQADDVIYQTSAGALYAYPNRGDGSLGKGVLVWHRLQRLDAPRPGRLRR